VGGDSKTKGGLLLPESTRDHQSHKGEVVAVGPGGRDANGNIVPMEVSVGQIVLYQKYGGIETDLEGEKYFILRQNEILCVLNE
jgi:chaperonin GroES